MTAQIVSIAYQGHTFITQMEQRYPVMTVRYMVEDVPVTSGIPMWKNEASKRDGG